MVETPSARAHATGPRCLGSLALPYSQRATVVYDWLMEPLIPLLAELAPCPPGVHEGRVQVMLKDYLDPVEISISLNAKDDEFLPQRVQTDKRILGPYAGNGVKLDLQLQRILGLGPLSFTHQRRF